MEVHNINENNSYSNAFVLSDKHFGEYYFLDDIVNTYPNFSKSYTGRKVLQNYDFKDDDYNFITYSSYNTIPYKFFNENNNKAKLFIKCEWVEKNIINAEKDYIDLPPLLKINDIPEFFKNGDFSMKFRGEKTREKILISIDSVAKILEVNVNVLKKKIRNGDYGLEKNKHFVLCGYKDKSGKFIKTPYFTYTGFTAYIFITRSKNAYLFLNYFETVIFASLFGTPDQKVDMVITHIVKKPKEIEFFFFLLCKKKV